MSFDAWWEQHLAQCLRVNNGCVRAAWGAARNAALQEAIAVVRGMYPDDAVVKKVIRALEARR